MQNKKTKPNNYNFGDIDRRRIVNRAGINVSISEIDNETNASNRTEGENNKDHERKTLTEANQVATDQSDQNGTDLGEEESQTTIQNSQNSKSKKLT